MKQKMVFYAVNTNSHTSSIHVSKDEALEEVARRLDEDDTDNYEIERIDSIWAMVTRFVYFEDKADNEWVEEVLMRSLDMIKKSKELQMKDSKNKK